MADIEYLKSLQAVRERAHLVLQVAERGDLSHFTYNPSRMPEVADFVVSIITRDFGPDRFDKIPPHGRWQHFEIGGLPRVDDLIQQWKLAGVDKSEITRRLIDLFFVSVLLDAGAGDVWNFTEPETGGVYGRSEGIAVAALYMFKSGAFTSGATGANEHVDGQGLANLTLDTFRKHFQISEKNPIVGDSSRVGLLNQVGLSLLSLPKYFGSEGRPGNLVGRSFMDPVPHFIFLTDDILDYLIEQKGQSDSLDFTTLWTILQETLLPAWPKNRTQISGVPIGDAWPLKVLENVDSGKQSENNTLNIQPFHKLTQWLAYSLTVPFMRVMDLKWINTEKGTGLPEYRNGGLFVDLEVLKLKENTLSQGLQKSQGDLPSYEATSDVIVEWRAMTVALLDKLHELVCKKFAKQGVSLNMPQTLEAGSWKGGRELAAKLRPQTKSSPILIDGDGTLF
ncbi:hypothetical protein N7462_011478 [Penicillium macrosclerotiorum]|uniref:uncharacterized protein n=1 Tax=Penicillium macrosclerotiorum TaxID=303699 RepID=UPI0025486D84|nr:uncharacterized protein N7462_011478 [Penicillium macrosclerotiorum]KAJ5664665.1 hypothetical protein N7462_011478 [Penicillium macrosclerotiorum]